MLSDYDIRYYIFLLLRALDYSHSQVCDVKVGKVASMAHRHM